MKKTKASRYNSGGSRLSLSFPLFSKIHYENGLLGLVRINTISKATAPDNPKGPSNADYTARVFHSWGGDKVFDPLQLHAFPPSLFVVPSTGKCNNQNQLTLLKIDHYE